MYTGKPKDVYGTKNATIQVSVLHSQLSRNPNSNKKLIVCIITLYLHLFVSDWNVEYALSFESMGVIAMF